MTDAQQSRDTLAAQLRELRRAAGLTGLELAKRAGWDNSKVSRFEHSKQLPTEADIRLWCSLTDAQLHIPQLIAAVRNIDAAYQEWRRMSSEQLQQRTGRLERQATAIRGYEPRVIPGLLQTQAYARTILTTCVKFIGNAQSVDDAVSERLKRQEAVRSASPKCHFLLDEQALYTTVGTKPVMRAQLAKLAELLDDAQFTIGIIPRTAPFVATTTGFAMYDVDTVRVELATASVSITQPAEVALYDKAFRTLVEHSKSGSDAAKMIDAALTLRR
ncbi:helix-turn-helix domain-containing protein [Nocardia sp. NPDC058640]|uniref:helix-turn-helix domain-containing protein n=1 Tax=Nocardia sp. NPDC058640 TaxID=3346571 RepID=UPI003653B114